MRIATWNLERPTLGGATKNQALISQMSTVSADVWILTETSSAIQLPQYQSRFSIPIAGHHLPGESCAAIFSRWPIARAMPTWDPECAVCVEVTSPLGPLLVYGTIITYASDPGSGEVKSKRWQEHRRSIEAHGQDWLRLRTEYPQHPMVVGGDFNQSRDGSGWYEDKESTAMLTRALESSDLTCLTQENFRTSQGLSRSSVDHVCVSAEFLQRKRDVGTWEGTIDGQRLSDHNGVYVQFDS